MLTKKIIIIIKFYNFDSKVYKLFENDDLWNEDKPEEEDNDGKKSDNDGKKSKPRDIRQKM